MKKREPVSQIMTPQPITVEVKQSLPDVMETIRKHHFRHVPVVNKGDLVGIISKTDLDRLSFSDYLPDEEDADDAIVDMLSVSQVMTHKPRVVTASETIYNVAKILSKEEYHALPVVDDHAKKKLVGIVTTTDVIRYMLEQYE
jgi:CBS domain-containing protein